MNNDRISGVKWLSFALLFIGLILKWLHFDNQCILLNIGFISVGLLSFIDGVKAKYYKQLNLDTIKLALAVVVMLLSLSNLLTRNSNYIMLGIAILFQYLLSQGKVLAVKRQQ